MGYRDCRELLEPLTRGFSLERWHGHVRRVGTDHETSEVRRLGRRSAGGLGPFLCRSARRGRRSRAGTPVLVGLDPRYEQLPEPLTRGLEDDSPNTRAAAYFRFLGVEIIDVVAAAGGRGQAADGVLRGIGAAGHGGRWPASSTTASRRPAWSILDGKRNDLGSTAEAYASGYLGPSPPSAWSADALTVSPYLGDDSLTPFVDVARQRGCGLFVLVKTSNPGGGMFQDLRADGEPVYRRVAKHVQQLAAAAPGECGYGAVGAVVGATYPEQLAELRAVMPQAWLLVPGYGSQGGRAQDVAAAFDPSGRGVA